MDIIAKWDITNTFGEFFMFYIYFVLISPFFICVNHYNRKNVFVF